MNPLLGGEKYCLICNRIDLTLTQNLHDVHIRSKPACLMIAGARKDFNRMTITKINPEEVITVLIGYYDYHLMTLSFACFISFQCEKRELEII